MIIAFTAILLGVSAVNATVGVVAFDNANKRLTRFASDGSVIWQNTEHTTLSYNLEIGPDGNIYLGGWTSDRVFVFDALTGFRSQVAIDSSIDRVSDITFGPDIDGDGVPDLYTATLLSKRIGVWTSSSGYSSGSVFSDPNSISVNANALAFGPDLYGDDGIGELFVVDGNANTANNMMRIINGATGVLEESWPLTNVRTPTDVVVGKDGRVYVSSAARNQVNSFLPDGTDERWNNTGITNSGMNFPRQLHQGIDNKWYVANRFAGTQSSYPAVTVYNSDITAFESVFVETQVADWTAVGTIETSCIYSASDLNGDCYVNLDDLGIFLNYWLTCTEPDPADCP